jgi:hypothetical protein
MKTAYSLDEVLCLAKKAGVGFSCAYCESDDTWYFTIDSIAPSEQWIGKNHNYNLALQSVLDYLKGILNE